MTSLAMLMFVALAQEAEAPQIVSKPLAYTDGNVQLEGVVYYDPSIKTPRPGVIVVHAWWGLNDFPKSVAKSLAEEGYVAFALDMYGKGVLATDAAGARELSSKLYAPQAMRQRATAGYKAFTALPQVDKSRVGAIGFCFGGTTVTQMAYTGLPLKAVVSLHGNLPALQAEDRDKVKASILALHGDADTVVPDEQVQAFLASLRGTGLDWELVRYADAQHSFTTPDGRDAASTRYNPIAAKRAMRAMRNFLAEHLKPATSANK